MVKRNGTWYYVKDGQVCKVTTLVKYNGSWWYVVNGKVASDTISLVKWNCEWWYVVGGKVDNQSTAAVYYQNQWYYVEEGYFYPATTDGEVFITRYQYDTSGRLLSTHSDFTKTQYLYNSQGKSILGPPRLCDSGCLHLPQRRQLHHRHGLRL